MLNLFLNRNLVLACSADCPADNHARQLAQFLYETLYTIRENMKSKKLLFVLILTLSLISCKGSSQEPAINNQDSELDFSEVESRNFPKPVGIINDYGQIFTEMQRTELSKLLYDYDIETTRQIVIVTVDSITPYDDIQKYATDLGNTWGVGAAEENNGLTIVICNPCRQIGIATGLGTELTLTDEICSEVIQNIIIPEFKNGKYYEGITKGVTELIEKWN